VSIEIVLDVARKRQESAYKSINVIVVVANYGKSFEKLIPNLCKAERH